MASNRIDRVNEDIQFHLSSMLRNLKDPRVQKTMISITRVETTPDLRYCKVFVSFLDKSCAKEGIKGLKSAGGYLRRELSSRMSLRYTPELVWAEDNSITHAAHIMDLLATLDIPKDEDEHDEESDTE